MPFLVRSRRSLLAALLLAVTGCGTESSGAVQPLEIDSLVVQSSPVTLAPGEERYLCQYFPPSGLDGWIDRISVSNFEGFHHLFVYRAPDDPSLPREPSPCDHGASADFVDAQLPVVNGGTFELPEGTAFVFDEADGLYFSMHLLNATEKAVDASLTWSAHTVPAGLAKPAGMLRFSNPDFVLPPHQETKVTRTCSAPLDVGIFQASGHFHAWTVGYRASIGGRMIIEGIGDRHATFDPPVAIHAGEDVTWTCDDLNTSADPIHSGPSFAKNEMCNFLVYGAPIPDSKTFHCN